jgi:hypothetical protein
VSTSTCDVATPERRRDSEALRPRFEAMAGGYGEIYRMLCSVCSLFGLVMTLETHIASVTRLELKLEICSAHRERLACTLRRGR